ILKRARCLVPNGLSHISRTVFLQQCISKNSAQGNETACYEELGCFPMEDPWVSLRRPLPSPNCPAVIEVQLYLYTRSVKERQNVVLWPNISLENTDFKASRPKTVFITHGFASNGDADWLTKMKDAYLSLEDANVFIVDWGKGASFLNYLQVASNTRIVGAELARFGKYLIEKGVNKSNMHLIGHSLGSHISSYMAKGLKDSTKVGRITALDPAQPAFENSPESVRLSENDAQFVDVLHTDARPFIPFLGFGMMGAVGHADFYLNGGSGQPGCFSVPWRNVTSLGDLAKIPVEVISQLVSCSHGRSYEVFTSVLSSARNCTLWGRKMPSLENFFKLTTLGQLSLADPLVKSFSKCSKDTCTILGLKTHLFVARGLFATSTNRREPFCGKYCLFKNNFNLPVIHS
ncbi:hypothetical protein AAG570_003772, partial [Ranatra chinensis]